MANDMSAEIPITAGNLDRRNHMAPSTDSIERYRQEAAPFREMLESGDPIKEAQAQERLRLLRIMTSDIHINETQAPDPVEELSPDYELDYPVKPEEKRVFDRVVARAVSIYRFFPDQAAQVLQKLREPESRDTAIRELEKLEAIRVKENE